MAAYREIYIKGYRRKDGTWVSPHTRIIKIGKGIGTTLSSYRGVNPDQLCFDFSGVTKYYYNKQ
jgi:hypothetical protein|tara:strand:+ start:2671 stop:2862 length:192 start_codon:yes stop_codon:yes gene_type:complete